MKTNLKLVSILIIAVVCIAWIFYPVWSIFYKDFITSEAVTEMGVFGDSFGALNTLFSGLAFTGIIVSIFIQSEELKATREELEATRYEMKNQGEQFKAQTEVLNLQAFENTFFNLLKLHGDIVESMTTRVTGGSSINGRPAFKAIIDKCTEYQYRVTGFQDYVQLYEHYHGVNEAVMGHYFRAIYQLIKFVDMASLDEAKKKIYLDILKAQLSTYEIIFLLLNCLSKHGEGEYKLLVEKHRMLEHISMPILSGVVGNLGALGEIVTRYSISAYGESNSEILEFYNIY